MRKNYISKTYALRLLTLVCCLYSFTFYSQSRPNIIVIMVDDMGYSDLGCTGSEIRTPHIDQLAATGSLFTNAYNTSRCCPSRASLLTGQYQWDAGIGHMDNDNSNAPEYQGYLNEKTATIAEILNQNGYQSFMSGKWHVGNKERSMWPDYHGFDQFYGTPAGGGIYFYPSQFYNRDVYWNGNQVTPGNDWYSTDAFTDYAINYIKNDKDPNKPFFMYLAYIAPHFPLQAKDEDIAKYDNVYNAGYESIRDARFEKQKELGIVPDDLPKSPIAHNWNSVSNKTTEARKMQVYAGMMDRLDQNIGKLVQALKDENIDEDTMIMFLSDNGGASNNFNRTPSVEIGGRNSNASYGKWYNVSNTPYRNAKKQEHEGGIITPLIVNWPNGLNNPQRIIKTPVHLMDIMPTCLQVAGVSYPETYNNVTLDPLDGESFMPMLDGSNNSPDPNRLFFWEHEGNKAARQGDWKLVARHNQAWELYQIKEDPYELNNLASQEPTIFEDLKTKYYNWAATHGVKDWPNLNAIPSPKELKGTAQNGSIVLNWIDGSKDEQGIKVERSVNGGSYSSIARIETANLVTFTDNNVTEGNTYSYRVRHFIPNVGNSGYSNTISVQLNPDTTRLNVAENKTIAAFSSDRGAYPATLAIDGNNSDTPSRWITAARAAYPHYIEIDLEGDFSIDELRLYTGYNGYHSPILDFKFQYWTGSQWQDALDIQNNNDAQFQVEFDAVETNRVRLETTRATNNAIRLYEIEVYGSAINKTANKGFTDNNMISVYPNPLKKESPLYIDSATPVKTIYLYDINGKRLDFERNATQPESISTEKLKSGLYFLNIDGKHFKIIKS